MWAKRRLPFSTHRLHVFRSIANKPPTEWRKGQLEKLSSRFSKNSHQDEINNLNTSQSEDEWNKINSDDDLQEMWKDMERRVLNRKLWTVEQSLTKGRVVGRSDVKRTDEEIWLESGLYGPSTSDGNENKNESK